MKKSIAISAGAVALLVCAGAFADDDHASATTTTTTTAAAPAPVVAEPVAGTTTTTYERHDEVVSGHRDDDRPRIKHGVGIDVIGAVGSTDQSALGLGGRLEFILPFGLSLGASYTHHFANNNGDVTKSRITPLLGEIGFSIPVWRDNVEIRPMVGIGYAFVNTSSNGNSNNNSSTASASVAGSGFDVAPGVKIAYMASGLEVYTMPKYHIINDLNFFALEVGAGFRF